MASVSCHIFLNNIHDSVSEELLRKDLLKQFPEFFLSSHLNGRLQVKVYLPRPRKRAGVVVGGIQVVATVSGDPVNVHDLQQKAIGKKVAGFYYNFKIDKGDPRDKYGDFLHKMKGEERRKFQDLHGVSHRRCSLFLHTSIGDQLENVFVQSTRVVFNSASLTAESVGAINVIKEGDKKVLRYSSILSCLQGIVAFNGKVIEGLNGVKETVVFTNSSGTVTCKLALQKGLNIDGTMMDLNDVQNQYGFIPFRLLNPDVVDVEKMESLTANCLKCKEKFHAIGIDKDMRFIAAKCSSCKYDDPILNFMTRGRAYSWPDESFTRLIELRQKLDSPTHLDVLFQPMKSSYSDASQYMKSVSPLAFWEMRQIDAAFEGNETKGPITQVQQVGWRGNTTSHAFQFAVPKTEFWNLNNQMQIGELRLKFRVEHGHKYCSIERKAMEFWIGEDSVSNDTCYISATVELNKHMAIVLPQDVSVIPYPDKTSYLALQDFLRKWAKGEIDTPWLQVLLDPSCNFSPNVSEIPIVQIEYYRTCIVELKNSLNEKQLTALNNSIQYPASVIVGPPGTGKTFTCGAILLTLKVLFPEEKAAAIAPSNYACDNICSAINKSMDRFFEEDPPFFVIRIYSKKREVIMRINKDVRDYGRNVKILHQEVDKEILRNGDENLRLILKRIRNGTFTELTETMKKSWRTAVGIIEKKILASCNNLIIVCTPSTFLDSRFRTREGQRTLNVDTILIDEAGSISKTESLPILDYKQKRVIYAGDDKQLRSLVINQSVELAGYSISTIEWLRIAESKVPWTTLQIQYRMTETLCRLVSDLSYSETPLRCGPNVPTTIPQRIILALQPKSPLVVYYHKGIETKTHTSYTNVREADIVREVCVKLKECNVSLEEITVMTLYNEQRKLLSSRLHDLEFGVKTCDSMQGKENEICIVSFVRSGENGIGFSRIANRINVMLSRAKRFMVLILNRDTFKNSNVQIVNDMLNLIETYGDVRRV